MNRIFEEILPGDNNGSGGERREVSLADILTPAHLKDLQKVIDDNIDDPDQMLTALKAYFGTQEKYLASKGVDPGYIAYFVYAKIMGVV